jgi:hypothetical protein
LPDVRKFNGAILLSRRASHLCLQYACKIFKLVLVLLLPEPLSFCHQLSPQQMAAASRTEPASQNQGVLQALQREKYIRSAHLHSADKASRCAGALHRCLQAPPHFQLLL